MRTALLSILLIFTSAITALSQDFDYQLKGIIGIPINSPADAAVDSADNLYLLDNGKVNKIDANDKLVAQFTVSAGSSSLDVDQQGSLYIANRNCACIIKYDQTGKQLVRFGSYGTGVGQSTQIMAPAIDSKGNVYFTDQTRKRVLKFNPQGQFVRYIGAGTDEGGTIRIVADVDFDEVDNLYVLESSTGTENITFIHKFSPEGQFLESITPQQQGLSYKLNNINSFAVKKDGGMFLFHRLSHDIINYDEKGVLIGRFAGFNPYDEGLYSENAKLKIDKKGNLFACDPQYPHASARSATVKKYTSAGIFIRKFGNDKKLISPIYDKYGNLYVYDALANTIHVYNPAGDIKLKINSLPFEGKYIDRGYLALDSDGNIYLLHFASAYRIQKFSKNGVLLKNHEFALPKSPFVHDFVIDQRGTMYITDFHNNKIHKLDPNGKYIGIVGQQSTKPAKFAGPQTVRFDAIGFMYVQDWSGNRIQKLSPDENLLFSFGDTSSNTPENFSNFSVDNQGNTYLSYYSNYDTYIRIYDKTGKEVKFIDLWHLGITVTRNGKSYATNLPDGTIGLYTSSNYNPSNYISGTIFEDKNGNCIKDADEGPITGVVVAAEPGPFYGLSDKNGNYTIAADSGAYVINQILPKELGRVIKSLCSTEKAVTLKGNGNNVAGPDFGNKVTLSPYLTTSVSSTRRRRCFESTTKLTYANTGFAPAENAKVYLQLPKEVELLSADKAYTRLPNGTYIFDVGTVQPGQTSVITIQDKVVCGDESIRGLTVCTKAWISTTELPRPPVVTGKCDAATGNVRFVIKNTSGSNMDASKVFKVYVDDKLATVEEYKLIAGDSLVLWIPAGGKTIRVETNLDGTPASATVEGCKVSGTSTAISTGMVNNLPNSDTAPDMAEECLPIVDSFDPNDKLVTPAGLTAEKFTPTGAELKYKIRFQNTGTDVAYRVVVVDTLSENLDLSTLQIGSASHTYRFDVSGKGKPVLTWTFDNIMLPDSTSNEPGSHGFIQFSIKPKTDLPEKTAVENFADIFFDYNSPVRTNITINRIYDMPPVVNEAVRLNPEAIIATPVLTGFEPVAGKAGTEVILTGSRFLPNATKVYFNGVAATVTAASDTELKVQVPASATSGTLKIETADGNTQSTEGFEVYQAPVISNFSPVESRPGVTVTLQGEHLTEEWLQTIKLGDQECEITSITGKTVTVKVPANAVTGKYVAISKGGETTSSSAFVVWHQPEVSNLSTLLDKVGASVTISGYNFAPAAARNKVWFNGVAAQVTEASETALKVTVPTGAMSGVVTVETPGGTANSPADFEVIPAPLLTDFSPVAGTVGTEVILTGRHFLTLGERDIITFNGEQATVLEATPTLAKVRVPRGATSGKIIVEGVGGNAISASDFKIETLTPEQAIEVYPNPNTGNFTIRFVHADFEVQQVQLYSALGALVYTENVATPRPDAITVKLSNAKAGIYILHIKTERGLVVKKLHIL